MKVNSSSLALWARLNGQTDINDRACARFHSFSATSLGTPSRGDSVAGPCDGSSSTTTFIAECRSPEPVSMMSTTYSEILFIDSSVENYQSLLACLQPGVLAIVLSPQRDGVVQITEILQEHLNVETVHILSHGSPGCLYLGNTYLGLNNLRTYAWALTAWFKRSALHPQKPTLALYGCNLAAGDAGQEFIDKLHNSTGAVIAASTTVVGNSLRGGNWQLDAVSAPWDPEKTDAENTHTNSIHIPFNQGILSNYAGIFMSGGSVNSTFTVNRTTSPATANLTSAPSTGFSAPIFDTSTPGVLSFESTSPGETSSDGSADVEGTVSNAFIQLNRDPSEELVSFTIDLTYDAGFDDGLFLAINGVTVVDFDESDHRTSTISTRYGNGNNWQPWNNEGNPQLRLIIDSSGNAQVELLVDRTDISGRDNILTSISGSTPNPVPNIDLETGLTFSFAGINDNGPGGRSTANLSASATFNCLPTSTSITSQTSNDGQTVTLDVSENFSDVDGTITSYSVSGLPDGLTIDANGVISGSINPNASDQENDDNGTQNYSVTVTATDDDGATASQTFTYRVDNVAPEAVDDSYSVDEDNILTGVNVLAGNLITNTGADSDGSPDSDTLTLIGNSDPANGTVTITSDGDLTYTPDANFNGTDTFTYTISDGNGGSDTATVTVTVTDINDDPTSTSVVPQESTDGETVTLDVSGNFSDVDGTIASYSVSGLPDGLTINSSGVISGRINPNASDQEDDDSGSQDYSVTVTATDDDGATTSQTFTYTVNNVGPDAVDDSYSVNEDTTLSGVNVLTGPGVDVDGSSDADTLTLIGNSAPANGSVSISNTGDLTYTSNANFNGTDTFTYTISDGNGGSDTATVTVSVNDINDAPTFTTIDTQTSNDGETVSLNVSGNFSDVDGTIASYSVSGLPDGLSIDASGVISGSINPNASDQADDDNGTQDYSVTVTATDDDGATTSQTFTYTVDNIDPNAVDDSFTTDENSILTGVNVLTGAGADSDGSPDSDNLTVISNTNPANGTVTLSSSGDLTYDPGTAFDSLAVGESATETFTYTISDGNGGTSTATVTVTITGQSELSITVPASASGVEDTNIPLGIIPSPTLTLGGSQLDIIGTEAGFRDAAAGTAATAFTIPPGTTSVRITAYGGNDNGGTSASEEEYQTTSILVDLAAGTYSGQTFHVQGFGQPTADNYAFSDVSLGSASDSGTITGDNANGFNSITVSRTGNTLSIQESQSLIDQAYLVEYQTSESTSANLLGSVGDFLAVNETPGTLALPTDTNFVVLTLQDGRGGLSFAEEDKGLGRIVVDLDTNLASGTIFAQTGRGGNLTAGFSFSGYDITSEVSILNSGATITGDTSANVDVLPDLTISLSGNDLIVDRTTNSAGIYTSLLTAQAYERLAVGSSAASLGTTQTSGNYFDNVASNTWELALPGSAETGTVSLAMTNIVGSNNNANENTGTAQIFVDLVNRTTSGSFLIMRTSQPDLITWNEVPFGTRLIDGSSTSNRATDTAFLDEIAAALTFDVATKPDGSQVLQATANPVVQTTASYVNYAVTLQAQWAGRLPIEISALPVGGSLSAGSFDPDTGKWFISPEELATLEFIPNEHFSGDTVSLDLIFNGTVQTIDISVTRVADAPTLTTVDQSGDEDTTFDISSAITAALVDADGSESITLIELSSIPVGHTISDGTPANTFTATAGNQVIDVTNWDLNSLTYRGATNANGTFTIGVRAQTTDDDGFSATTDTAESIDSFDVTVTDINDDPTSTSIDPQTSTDGETVTLDVSGNFSDVDGTIASYSVSG
ncbi:MAG: Ig-like domain-containing protein, partial [Synechococcus sp.]